MVTYYHRFIPHAATLLRPLYLARQGLKKNQKLEWSEEMNSAFIAVKKVLASATLLVHPIEGAQLALISDASDIAIGAVLQQKCKDKWEPLAFFSKHLRGAELQYSAFDKELLALYLAVRHFRCFLEGRSFTAYTDQKPLVNAINRLSDPWLKRQRRHLTAITEFTTDVKHISGIDNVVADALSRPSIASVQLGIDYRKMAEEQAKCKDIASLSTAVTSLKLKHVDIGGTLLLCDTTLKFPRPYVPQSLRRATFAAIHELSHPGISATVRLAAQKFVWHGLKKDIRKWTRECIPCQAAKIRTHTKTAPDHIAIPSRRFDHIHLDIVGPLPPSQGHTHLLTIVDRFTRWPTAIPLRSTDTRSCVRALLMHWVSTFGVPANITSDRGAQFTSQIWKSLAELLGTNLHTTTAYHPQSNGLVERMHRQLKDCLKARLVGPDWCDQLPWVLLGMRTTPKEDLGASSAELVFGSQLTVPADLVYQPTVPQSEGQHLKNLRAAVGKLAPINTKHHNHPHSAVPKALHECPYVFIQKGNKSVLLPPYEGPFRVQSF